MEEIKAIVQRKYDALSDAFYYIFLMQLFESYVINIWGLSICSCRIVKARKSKL
jgi:hypothetical protein